MEPLITHFTDNDLYTFTCQYYILETYPRAEVEYTFFDRNGEVYPEGFAQLLQEQMEHMREVVISEEEIQFLKHRCYFLPLWYFTFLRGYRFNPRELSISQDAEGHLEIVVRGKWFSTIMWEMPLLSCISELMHGLRGDFGRYDAELEEMRAREKTVKILENGLILGDMGTRRRFSFAHQDMVIRVMKETADSREWPGRFTGTSNVWLAMKYDCVPLGTMSHQLISFEENVSGVNECNFNVMKKFSRALPLRLLRRRSVLLQPLQAHGHDVQGPARGQRRRVRADREDNREIQVARNRPVHQAGALQQRA